MWFELTIPKVDIYEHFRVFFLKIILFQCLLTKPRCQLGFHINIMWYYCLGTVSWTAEQREVVRQHFHQFIEHNKVPKRKNCEECIAAFPVLAQVTWLRIKDQVNSQIQTRKRLKSWHGNIYHYYWLVINYSFYLFCLQSRCTYLNKDFFNLF